MKIRFALHFMPHDLARRLARGDEMARKELTAAIHALALAAQRRAKREAPKDTGLLRSSIGIRTRPLWAWVGSRITHAAPMEFGAKPHWPPEEPIERWVWLNRAKFGVVTPKGRAARGAAARREVARIAFAIRRAIGRRGLKARGYIKAAMQEVNRRAPRIVGQVARRIATRLVSR